MTDEHSLDPHGWFKILNRTGSTKYQKPGIVCLHIAQGLPRPKCMKVFFYGERNSTYCCHAQAAWHSLLRWKQYNRALPCSNYITLLMKTTGNCCYIKKIKIIIYKYFLCSRGLCTCIRIKFSTVNLNGKNDIVLLKLIFCSEIYYLFDQKENQYTKMSIAYIYIYIFVKSQI